MIEDGVFVLRLTTNPSFSFFDLDLRLGSPEIDNFRRYQKSLFSSMLVILGEIESHCQGLQNHEEI